MSILKRLLTILFLGMVIAGPATPIFKSLFGVGSTIAHAQDDDQGDDDQGEDNNDQ